MFIPKSLSVKFKFLIDPYKTTTIYANIDYVFILRILKNRNFILLLAFILGLLIGNKIGIWIKYLTVPALAIIMIASFTQFPFKIFLDYRSLLKPALYSIFFSYFINGAVILALSWFLIHDKQLWIGFIILAASPPGVAIPPFARITGGDEKFTIIGMVSTYIAALIIIPLVFIIFIGGSFTQLLKLIILFVEVIIGPIIISQLLIKFKLDKYIIKFRGSIVNWGFFVITFVIIALNRNLFFKDFKILGFISLISIISIFGLWILLNYVLKKLKFTSEVRGSLILFGTIKNSSFAAATAISLFSERASVPGAIFSVFLIIYLIIISFLSKKNE